MKRASGIPGERPARSGVARSKAVLLLQVLLVLAACSQQVPREDPEVQAIRQLLLGTWDTPQKDLVVEPVAIAGDYAIADWTQGPRGGRALLRRKAGAWNVDLCAGDYLRDALKIENAGVPTEFALALAAALAEEEKAVSPDRRARMASFQGIMRIHPVAVP